MNNNEILFTINCLESFLLSIKFKLSLEIYFKLLNNLNPKLFNKNVKTFKALFPESKHKLFLNIISFLILWKLLGNFLIFKSSKNLILFKDILFLFIFLIQIQ